MTRDEEPSDMNEELRGSDYPGHPETGVAPQPTGPEDPDTTTTPDSGDEDARAFAAEIENDPAYAPVDERLKDIKGG